MKHPRLRIDSQEIVEVDVTCDLKKNKQHA
jgi:hypothetical protein